ncbi:MAG: pilus assembly protein PilM [Candidatus Omnitrophica bacterium]|nr:pilus assembly protein PilM [Candidatus Omnitrophota bacterium]
MADSQTHIGLYWGKKSLSLAEAGKGGAMIHSSFAPFEEALSQQTENVPEGLLFTDILQKAFSQSAFSQRQIILSIPTQDLIFRSFVIPWMAPNEIRGVVEFEVTKYVPIKVEELVYTFHSIPFEKDKLKNLRVIFVAIRKKTLEKYKEILQHTDIKIAGIEPGAVSIFRLLKKQKIIPHDHSSAIVLIENNSIHIIMIDNDVVQFVRESPFPFDVKQQDQFVSRLFTDLRVSINFFTRQNATAKVKRIVLISQELIPGAGKAITEDFKIPVLEILASDLIKGPQEIPSLGLLSAFGAALKPLKLTTKDFNLGQDPAQIVSAGTSLHFNIEKYKPLLVSAALSALVIFAVIHSSNSMAQKQYNRMESLNKELGPYKSLEKKDIEKMSEDISGKLSKYKNVRVTSDLKYYLYKIPSLMPYGMWLKSMKIRYEANKSAASTGSLDASQPETRRYIELQGYVYQDSINDQFQLINQFYSAIKEQDGFKNSFKNIELKTRQEELQHFKVSFFVITCS